MDEQKREGFVEKMKLGDQGMAQAMTVVNGFCFGVGLILAAAAMRVVFHMSLC